MCLDFSPQGESIPLLETAHRELLAQTELLCTQPTAGKPLTNRAPLGQAAPDSPVGTLSRHFLLEKATATLWWPPLLALFLQWRKNAAKSPLTPNRSDDGSERPFWREIGVALRSRITHYDFQKERFRFDRETFELVDLQATGAMPSTAERGTSP